MADNKNQNLDQQNSDQDQRLNQNDQRGNVSNTQDNEEQNPQEGKKWANYQTRELASDDDNEGSGDGKASTPRDSE